MPEQSRPSPDEISEHEARLIEVQEDQGIINHTMAEGEATGTFPPRPTETFEGSAFAQGVKAEKTHRRLPALPGLEAGAISGRDQARLIANEAAKNEPAVPVTEIGRTAAAQAKLVAHRVAYMRFLQRENILSLPIDQQMKRVKAWEEKHPAK